MTEAVRRSFSMLRQFAGLSLLLVAASASAAPTHAPEPELRLLMKQAIDSATSFDDRYLAEIWLTDMSGRMARYVPKAIPDTERRLSFLRLLHAEATKAGISPELVLATIDVESRFDRFAVSSVGALGYMQIMPFWIEEIGQKGDNLFHTPTNLRLGCTILKFYLAKEKGSYVKALARYNGSIGKPDYPYLVLDRLTRRWSR
ncbi:lytic transglycosylase domain-containing protein [Nevskia sp.]|uniref:lytic transglycosylase domain-containing protein n=1 Tax=Nevskia sp. TaxID=1929292 RepID=UPI0025D7E363|nr:lytic transglycosylase domain-containing protein [Nevskia sp.]